MEAQTGGSSWAAAWTTSGETCKVQSPGLTYADAAGNVLTTSGLSASTTSTATSRNFRTISSTAKTSAWISFLWKLPSTNALFEGVTFYRGTTTEAFAIANLSTSTSAEMMLRYGTAGTSVSTSIGTFGQTYLLVLQLIDGGGTSGADLVKAYVNPLLSTQPTTANASGQAPDLSFDTIRIAGQNGATLFVDEIRIGSTYADVVPYAPAPNADPDNDGLTTTQEALLGTDPNVSDLALFNAIKLHPEYLGLFDPKISRLSVGEVVVPKAAPADTSVLWHFEVSESFDLLSWTPFHVFQTSIALPPGKDYLRVSLQK